MLQSRTITVKGKVQGVFFRQTTKETAIRYGITGEVQNLPDGDVHIIATGTEEQLNELVAWCHTGPEKAVVSEVIVEKIPLRSFAAFTVIR